MSTPFAGPFARTGTGPRHFAPLGFRGFNNRVGANRFGFNRHGFDRFDSRRFDNRRFDFDRFGADRFRYNRFGRNANALDSRPRRLGLLGLPAIVSDRAGRPSAAGGPRLAINVYAGGDAGAGELGAARGGACPVVHLLNYDQAGHYIGERQISAC